MDDCFIISTQDKLIIESTNILLRKIKDSSFVRPAELVSISKLMHIFSKLPKYTNETYITLTLSGPRLRYGDHEIWHYWQISVEQGLISVSSSGHFYRPSTGGDSFTCMQWSAFIGNECEYNDYLDQLGIVDDAQPYDSEVQQLNLSEGKYSLEVSDDDNPLLEEISSLDEEEGEPCEEQDEETEDDEKDWANADPVSSTDPLEMKLDTISNEKEGFSRKMFGYYSEITCDLCRTDLSQKKYIIDGKIKREIGWGLMCAKCYDKKGDGIRWGVGQLYVRLTNGRWLMTAGFPPE